jgi:hypothetical protein
VKHVRLNGVSKNAAGKNHTQVKCLVGKTNAGKLTDNKLAVIKGGCEMTSNVSVDRTFNKTSLSLLSCYLFSENLLNNVRRSITHLLFYAVVKLGR